MAVEVDWGSIDEVCRVRSVTIEQNRRDLPLDDVGPVRHKDSCWLGANYKDQPDKWAWGCDQNCVREAVQEIRNQNR